MRLSNHSLIHQTFFFFSIYHILGTILGTKVHIHILYNPQYDTMDINKKMTAIFSLHKIEYAGVSSRLPSAIELILPYLACLSPLDQSPRYMAA